ncbi:MAG: HAD family hydrolase [Tetragenococcus koreensis]|uniref:HAD family hydrolase n=1 Tax=Tetragenococcus halophilus TaxID=51669 RepID=UPI001928A39E|nr:HAD family hydrolase [Tetragenococcus halophilus]MDN6497428.1 HAD family hydrolase [Tetragenococcus koreensis]MDN6580122.1 HAD family hydrolase [Tetragenococcus koreensis]MDN6598715.1 HAD family hydrolase [Tetragenococcus koreensis]MDN6744067.1 HAD family hydrolase [Tetragenococcus halophilus]GEQ38492.1 HAD family hydrolase [Tetragenococcus halophilus]
MEDIFVFDIDDTLYDQLHAFERAINNQKINNNKDLDISKLYYLMKKYGDETFSSTGFDQQRLEKMQIFRIQRALQDYNIEITDKQALNFQTVFENYQNDIELFPKMEKLLNLLIAKGNTLGIITNGTLKRQSKKIKMLNLEKWIPWNNILISEEVGVSKPEKLIFKKFEERLSISPMKQNIIYIGDNYLNDISGAKSAGWQTVWVNYRNYDIPKECETDYMVQKPEDLFYITIDLLYKINGSN